MRNCWERSLGPLADRRRSPTGGEYCGRPTRRAIAGRRRRRPENPLTGQTAWPTLDARPAKYHWSFAFLGTFVDPEPGRGWGDSARSTSRPKRRWSGNAGAGNACGDDAAAAVPGENRPYDNPIIDTETHDDINSQATDQEVFDVALAL